MVVDAMTLAAAAAEFNTTILDGRVQSIVAPDQFSFGLEVYANRRRSYLLISADPKTARCQLVPEKFRRGVDHSSTLGQLLSKYVDDARLTAIVQPRWERILQFHFSGIEGDVRLIAEMMGRRSNLILTVEDEILDSLRRIPPAENRHRAILPRRTYIPPPAQKKLSPDQVTARDLAGIIYNSSDVPAWRVLVDSITGVSPMLAREVVHRACGSSEAPASDLSPEILHRVFRSIIADALADRWSPCIVRSAGEDSVTAFAAYPLTHLVGHRPIESISAAMSAYFAATGQTDPYRGGRATIHSQIEQAQRRLRRKLAALDREIEQAADIETLRKQGELLLAYSSTIQPNQTVLIQHYDPDKPPLTISLDPKLKPAENARRYFDRYEKARRAVKDIPAVKQAAEQEAAYLDQLATDLALAENWPELDAVRDELQRGGYWQGPKIRAPQSGRANIRRVVAEDGFVILIGRNAGQNHLLITQKSNPEDTWLHARELSGSHVIIRNDGRAVPESVVHRAAELAAYYSAGRGEGTVDVIVTLRRHVRPVKGGRPGQVTFRRERILSVKPGKGD